MDHRVFVLAPLASVFALSILACTGFGPCNEIREQVTLTPEELLALFDIVDTGGPLMSATNTTTSNQTTTASTTTTTTTSTTGSGTTTGSSASTTTNRTTTTETLTNGNDPRVPVHTCFDTCERVYGITESCAESINADGNTELTCVMLHPCGGRFHVAINPHTRASGSTELGAWLSQMCHDEAASVLAFVALEEELRSHNAPLGLRRRILAASQDEVRHAAMIRDLVELRGDTAPHPVPQATSARSLLEIAIENVIEGCVHETWLAMRAWVQASQATDPKMRSIMKQIALDETRHAELARDLDVWMRSQLTAPEFQHLDTAKAYAAKRLIEQIDGDTNPRFVEVGMPSLGHEQALVRSLAQAVWK